MRQVNAVAKLLPLFAILLLLGSLLAGCGGGGGGGGNNGGGNGNNSNNIIINGTVIETAPNSTPLVGWKVEFDGTETTTTGAGGAFSLGVPPGAITASDTLTVLDPNNNVQAIDSFDFETMGPSPIQLPNPLTVGPPVPPGGV